MQCANSHNNTQWLQILIWENAECYLGSIRQFFAHSSLDPPILIIYTHAVLL